MKKYFLSFATTDLRRSLKRIGRQADDLNFYDYIFLYDEYSLNDEFKTRYDEELVVGSRGYGYWSWKPQVIKQVLELMNEGDILQYTDVGCHINPKGINRLVDYFDIVERSNFGLLAFEASRPNAFELEKNVIFDEYFDAHWCKGDLLDFMGVRNDNKILYTPTVTAGVLFIKKCKNTIELIREWQSVIEANFNFINDSPSNSKNMDGFIEHRHDQAIFSILAKRKQIETLSIYEYCWPSVFPYKTSWTKLQSFPVHARRDKDYGFIKNLIILMKKIFNIIGLVK